MLSLREMGLDAQRDNINIQAIGDSTVIAQSLATGIIDAAPLDKLQSVKLQGLGIKVRQEWVRGEIERRYKLRPQ
jgi:hypothetical protein